MTSTRVIPRVASIHNPKKKIIFYRNNFAFFSVTDEKIDSRRIATLYRSDHKHCWTPKS